jgi:tRNA G37 N-methylase Trm5
MYIKNATDTAREIIKNSVKPNDTVIDATAGNGNDTLLLAGLVGDEGMVYSFDIQKTAIDKTQELIDLNGLSERVTLINDGHENLLNYIDREINYGIFNLGYLPGGDKSIKTKPETTIKAINAMLSLLKKNGLMLIVVYHGKDSGEEEKKELDKYIKGINQKKYTILQMDYPNWKNKPPFLLIIEKIVD